MQVEQVKTKTLQELYDPQGKLHLGLVMAGAVSAGAYTGGVLDYLFNTLDPWEKEYKKNPDTTIEPNVIIDTITGASAGSMAAAAAILSLATGRYKPATLDKPFNSEDNLQYYAWVEYGLKKDESILDLLVSESDLADGKIYSLLNSSFIDQLGDRLQNFIQETENIHYPSFLSEHFEVLMTVTNLRGVEVKLKFDTVDTPIAHVMSYHKGYVHFKNARGRVSDDCYPLDLRDKKSLERFIQAARASGAFPLGLKSVPFERVDPKYIKANLKKLFDNDDIWEAPKAPYDFLAVDGGMMNNEPIAETLGILDQTNERALLVIDPFPHPQKAEEFDISKNTIFDIVPQLYSALRNQAIFKEKDLQDLLTDNSPLKMIWPARGFKKDEHGNDTDEKKPTIATGAFGGFAGFFHPSFRVHDYHLGQKNCQHFLRRYFFLPVEEVEDKWTKEQIDKFKFKDSFGNVVVPIIPDYRITGNQPSGMGFVPEIESSPNFPKYPTVTKKELLEETIRPRLTKRVKLLVKYTYKYFTSTASPEGMWKKAKYKFGRFGRFGRFLLFIISRRFARKKITNTVMEAIELSLEKAELFKTEEKM